jgi:H+-transporting ATPase
MSYLSIRDLGALSIPETLAALGVEPGRGLGLPDVEARRKEYGPNEILPPKDRPVLEFLGKFWGVSAWMLEAIIVLSIFLRKYSDLVVVGALLILNAVLGFLQERRAAGAVENLRRRLQVTARALRESVWRTIPARELVAGDIVRVRAGDIVPADLKLLTGGTRVDQSALTGESGDVEKNPGALLSSGSVVRLGEGNGVVLATGARTSFGRTTELVQRARPKLHIEAVVAKMVRVLFAVVGSLLAGVVALSAVRGSPFLEMAPLILVLLMSAVPVALPVMFTVSTALAAREMGRHGVLVTRLSAIEDAATMDVLCVDKTGTLTLNRLTVAGVIPLGGAAEADVLAAGALASRKANQDPIDLAFFSAAEEKGVFPGESPAKPVSFVPFNPGTRRTEAIVEQGGRRVRVMKGAVRSVAGACGLEPGEIGRLEAMVGASSRKGYRSLAVARGPETGRPSLLGLVTLSDPPRPDASRLIDELRARGVSVKMLTGDALSIAGNIGAELGLPRIRSVTEFEGASGEIDRKAVDPTAGVDGFAEVYPEDKYLVVRRLQEAGHVTGMTGDGINDAPALRQAEVGIAVSSATDVAKSAASVVLTEPGLADIVSLVRYGRASYQRVLTWIINKISRTILKAGFVAVAYVATGRFVVSAFAMLLLVSMTDFAKISIATDNVHPGRKPETWKIRGYIVIAAVLGLVMMAEALLFLFFAWSRFGLAEDGGALYTFSFLLLLFFAAFSILSVRERRWFWSSRPSRALLAGVAVEFVAGTALATVGLPGLTPLPWPRLFALFVYAAFCCLVVNDGLKVAMIRKIKIE